MKKKMLNSRTTFADNHKSQSITNKHKSHNRICLPSITSSKHPSSEYLTTTPSSTSLIRRTNAILVKSGNNNLVSTKQERHSLVKQQQQLYQNKQELVFSRIISSRRQLVNPYSNNISDNHRSNKIMMSNISYLTTLLLALCALSQFVGLVTSDSNLQNQMTKFKIPDLFEYDSYIQNIRVDLHGNIVKPGDVVLAKNFKGIDINKITWEASDSETRHTLLLLDLDRARSTTNSNNNSSNIYNQYTSLNIPGSSIGHGQAVVGFDVPVVPCQPSIKHRILVLALSQKQSIDIADVAYMSAPSGYSAKRENFKLAEFLKRHRLDPVAANVFYAIGESNGVCSGSQTIQSMKNHFSLILIAMVISITAYDISSRKLFLN